MASDTSNAGFRFPLITVILTVGLLAAACSSTVGDIGTSPTTPPESSEPQPDETTPAPTPTKTVPGSVEGTTSTTRPLAGSPYVGPGPTSGDVVAVIGVAYDDVLNVRTGPGIDYPVVATFEPTKTAIRLTGDARQLSQSIWHEVIISGETGWVNSAYLGMLGLVDDSTREVWAMLGEPVGDDDLVSLGAMIAFAYLGDESGGWTSLLVAPSSAEPTTVVFDVIGILDDAVKGYRLSIATLQETPNGPFELTSVERQSICWRGVDADGFCV